ncbi:MAG: twin-arginine translocase TatA/TatE family subunit [Mucilaginibacter sp.]|uniref:twin-arginine translocase TatA/TatE family subunit n=1 Tax=Mucilaginibacter sp. TaxID=1882438 RepID=UPI0032662143
MLSSTLLFLSPGDITLILVAALVLFGGKKLPELARGLGQGIKEFKNATDGTSTDTQPPVSQTPPPPPAPPVYQAPPVTPPAAQHASDLPDYTPVNQTHPTPPAQQ